VLPGLRAAVLEGDVQGSFDADRLSVLHVPVAQLNTGNGFGGECHLDANMVRSALPALPLDEIDLLVIENVGNLVCPASYDLGEDARAVLLSVTEGEDKPLKYPTIFNTADVVVVTKLDLAVAAGFDRRTLLDNLRRVRPDVHVIEVSARTGQGIDDWIQWLGRRAAGTPVATAVPGSLAATPPEPRLDPL